jgi:hypothetical protein
MYFFYLPQKYIINLDMGPIDWYYIDYDPFNFVKDKTKPLL